MMSSDYEANLSEREFLHDLSNPLSIAFGNIKIIAAKMESDPNSIDAETILTKLNKAVKAFEKANHYLDQRRNYISSQD